MEKVQNSSIIRQLYLDAASGVQYTEENNSVYNSTYSSCTCLKPFNIFFNTIKAALADYTLTLNTIITQGDRVMVQYTINGIHQAEFMGLFPTYQRTSVTGIDIFRLDNGKVVEYWDSTHQIISIPRIYGRRSKRAGKLSPAGIA